MRSIRPDKDWRIPRWFVVLPFFVFLSLFPLFFEDPLSFLVHQKNHAADARERVEKLSLETQYTFPFPRSFFPFFPSLMIPRRRQWA